VGVHTIPQIIFLKPCVSAKPQFNKNDAKSGKTL